jgi:maltose O-acetyltransferase
MAKFIYRVLFFIRKRMDKEKIKRLKADMKYCGSNVKIETNCHFIVPQQLVIGNNSSISAFTTIFATFGVVIGKNCLISSNCSISSYNHIQNSDNRIRDFKEDYKYSKEVILEDNVWIGMNSCIIPGVVIGKNSIIGAGSVVTKNIPSNEIWAGNPAKFIKKL